MDSGALDSGDLDSGDLAAGSASPASATPASKSKKVVERDISSSGGGQWSWKDLVIRRIDAAVGELDPGIGHATAIGESALDRLAHHSGAIAQDLGGGALPAADC
ncbi:hypothetical protein LBMAG53_13470 [Planctomycetota bacterium]|nr:hypothetical protein LBMAG53_13470 [Planctomycetota bacterium]